MNLSRKSKLLLNTVSSIGLEIVGVIAGFILPRMILSAYGSNVNGLVNSIAQFLGVISLLDLGVGAVVKSTLYKPLADNNGIELSKIYVSASKFFKRLAMILFGYIVVLLLVYPNIINRDFDYWYTAILIGAISISLFAQYYFGIVNGLLLQAHQKGYIQNTIQIITVIINTILCIILIKRGASIQVVKFSTSMIFIIRPIYLSLYVKKNYNLDSKISYTEEPIKQKWNGMAQHFASYVLSGTDNIVLTLFSTLANVSIYSVYNIVIIGVKNALLSMTNGFQALIGELLAKKETDKLNSFFAYVEWLLHTCTILVFGCTGVLIVSFVKVYTRGVTDADYIQPLFAVLITVANAGHCLRLPYNILILAAGHYKQTQSNYIIAMSLNICISIATVKMCGLIGVSIGTLVAMTYQTIWMAWYDSKNIIKWPFKNFMRQCLVDFITVLIASIITYRIPLSSVSFSAWFILAIEVFSIWIVIVGVINYICYRDKMIYLYHKAFKRKG